MLLSRAACFTLSISLLCIVALNHQQENEEEKKKGKQIYNERDEKLYLNYVFSTFFHYHFCHRN